MKGSTRSDVYYIADGKRYAFPSERVFFGWYTDFSCVESVGDALLSVYQLGGLVSYRPGLYLVKIDTDPKVYAVSRYGVLRWITSEQIAQSLYGPNWNTKVHDLPVEIFTNYLRGQDIVNATEFNPSDEQSTTVIKNNIRPSGYVPPVEPTPVAPAPQNPGSVSVVLSTSQATLNQMLLVFADVSNNTHPIATLEVFSTAQTAPLATCTRSTTCSFPYMVTQAPLAIRFFAVATDDLGVRITTPVAQQAALSVAAVSTDIQMSVTPLELTAASRGSFTSDAKKFGNITSHIVYATITGEPNPVVWKNCGIEKFCASSTPFYRTTQLYSKVVTGGQSYQSASVTVKVTSGTPPKPTLTLLNKPNSSQAVLRLDAPNGETIGWSTVVIGTSPDNDAIALCEYSSCEITVQFSKPQTYTGFTDVGGKLEASNSLHLEP